MRHLVCLLLLVAGCSSAGQNNGNNGDGGPIAGLLSIEIMPASAALTTDGTTAATQQFTALGHFADGHTADVSGQVAWSLTNITLGTIDGSGAFQSVTEHGGRSSVQASSGSTQAAADLTVKLAQTSVSTSDGSTAPPDSANHFAGATEDPTLAPALAYPLDGALVPHNLGLLEVQWKKPSTPADLFEVSFENDVLDFKLYTNALQPNGGRLSLTPSQWQSIADSVAGGKVQVAVKGAVTAQPGKVGTSSVATLTVGQGDVQGGIYYFSTVSATGAQVGQIMRHAFGDTTQMASSFYSPMNASNQPRCVGCHVLTRDGTRFAITYDGGNGAAAELDVAALSNILPEAAGEHWNFAAFSPDGMKMVATSMGTLKIIDTSGGAATGTVLETLADGSPGHYASHPDWSPDGKSIVYVSVGAPDGMSEWTFTQGSLVVAHADAMDNFSTSAPQMLVQSQGENNYYPSYSPDGKWILFNRNPSVSAYNAPSAEVLVISADGMTGPIALASSNGAVANVTNSWPRWSPFVIHGSGETGDLLYFTFSSTRDYGIELVGENPPVPQVWMAAFDPNAASTKMDPSSVPFWMPYQDVHSHNHIAQWTQAIVGIN